MPREGRGLADSLRKDEHLLTVLRYVEGNPVRAGLVNSAKEWLWFSLGKDTTECCSAIALW